MWGSTSVNLNPASQRLYRRKTAFARIRFSRIDIKRRAQNISSPQTLESQIPYRTLI